MLVTQVTEISKNKSKVFIDSEFAFVLYKGELRIYHVQEGREMTESDYRTIVTEVLPKRAKLRCMNLLKSRDYTEAQLRLKLKQGGYTEDIIQQALSYVKQFGYVDDVRYARDYISCYAEGKSRMKIEYALLQKGISKETVEAAWDAWQEEGNEQNEEQMIIRLLQKKNWNPETQDRKEQQKTAAFLLRKGFRMESIRRVMKNWEI